MLTNIANSNIKFGMYSNIAPWTAVTFWHMVEWKYG